MMDFRFDAEFYNQEYLELESVLENNIDCIKLSEVAEKSKKRFNPSPNPTEEFKYIEIDDINLYDGNFTYKNLFNHEAPSRARNALEFEDILISNVRPIRNAISIFLKHDSDFVCSTGFTVIKAKKISPYYLFAFLKTIFAIKQLTRRTSAAMYPAVNADHIMNMKIINPDDPFKQNIENNIKLAFKKQDSARDKYAEAEKILELELKINKNTISTENITITNHSEFVSTDRMDAQYFSSKNLNSLFSKRFKTFKLGEVCEKIGTGLTPSKASYWHKGYPVLKMGALTNSGIDWSKIEFANEKYYQRAKKNLVKEEDIFLTSSAHSIDHIAKKVDIIIDIPHEYSKKLVFVGEIMGFRVKSDFINPYYLMMFFRTELGYKLLQNCIRGQTAHIYSKDVENILIPLVPEIKQLKIKALIKEAHNLLSESSQLIETSIKSIEKLIIQYGD